MLRKLLAPVVFLLVFTLILSTVAVAAGCPYYDDGNHLFRKFKSTFTHSKMSDGRCQTFTTSFYECECGANKSSSTPKEYHQTNNAVCRALGWD